jgi:methylated-DNA-protein-cysteine methyltransferase-like protein
MSKATNDILYFYIKFDLMEDSFFQKVYDVVEKVPFGKVTTYGAIAEHLGSKGSARMVGWALNSSKHMNQHLPAHRVINRTGRLTGKNHFGGNDIMAELLINEGVEVIDNCVVNMEKYFWNPEEIEE